MGAVSLFSRCEYDEEDGRASSDLNNEEGRRASSDQDLHKFEVHTLIKAAEANNSAVVAWFLSDGTVRAWRRW